VALALGHAPGAGGRIARRRARLVPSLAPVVAALDDLPEPAAGLRGVDAVRVRGRALHVIDLPAGEERAADVPFLALAVRRENERALAGPDENADGGHGWGLLYLRLLMHSDGTSRYSAASFVT